MKRKLHLWDWISGIGIMNVPETEKRTVIVLNRINFFIVLTGLTGFLCTVVILWLLQAGRLFGIGSVRMLLMMFAGLVSFMLSANSYHYIAKILTSTLPIFFLVVLPTLLGNSFVEYYFYYPFACTASAIIPILLFPTRSDRIELISLLIYSFLLTVTIDNMLTYFSYPEMGPGIFHDRYFFFKLAQILIFVFIVSIVLTLKVLNAKYESILIQKNNELEKYKTQLEELVELRTVSLRESEIRFRSIFEAANDSILIMKEELIVDCNNMTTVMFGCSKEQIIGRSPGYFSPDLQPDGRNSAEAVTEKTRDALQGISQRFEWLHINAGSKPFSAEVSLTRIDLKGQYFLLALVRDITIRKNFENALQISENRFRHLVDSLTDYIYTVWIESGNIVETNHGEGCLSVTGYSSREFLEDPSLWISIVPDEDKQFVKDLGTRMISGVKTPPLEHRIIHKNGTVKWIRNTSVARFNNLGIVFAYDGLISDITDRKRAEEDVRESEKKFRNIFNESRHGIIIVSPDLNVLAANKMFTEISGYTLENLTSISEMVAPEYRDQLRMRMANTNESYLPAIEYKAWLKDGRSRIVEANSSLIDYNGQPAWLVNLKDVTDIREAEHKVMEAIINTEETERSRIAQDLHDGLGPVLSTIKLYFQVYEDAKDESKKSILTEKLKNTIEEAIKGVSEISHNISPHILRNHGFYAAIRQFIHQIALTKVVKLTLEDGNEIPLSETNGIILYRTITELINNSIKHADCRNIGLSFREQHGTFIVEYSDDGKGFDESLKNEPHLGSGLQNIRNRVKSLYGVVDIKSMPGHGMSAMIQIPL